ncbi:hypothetical protein GIB67_032688 [Kingdonia uniflora]|uniref:chitinase n=1 Tax=Kingdonia uniflora TaxID=39325 RepID=A0A7J7MVX3_9MAGN|nr:hypothetical protein GIB67_032688 [Kingdonia uniflora]
MARPEHFLTLTMIVTTITDSVTGQNCNCPSEICCSQYGYCGTGEDYYGEGCKEGACRTHDISVADIVTPEFFNYIINQSARGCAGKTFYSRDAFLEAIDSYPRFGTVGSQYDSKREIAAFFAHVTHETHHFCYIEELDGASKDYCNETNTRYPCVSGRKYYGRGPLQLLWNFNYGPAGSSIGFDDFCYIEELDGASKDYCNETNTRYPCVSGRKYYGRRPLQLLWNFNYGPAGSSIVFDGFVPTVKAISDEKNSSAVQARVAYYRDYCEQFGVLHGVGVSGYSIMYCVPRDKVFTFIGKVSRPRKGIIWTTLNCNGNRPCGVNAYAAKHVQAFYNQILGAIRTILDAREGHRILIWNRQQH